MVNERRKGKETRIDKKRKKTGSELEKAKKDPKEGVAMVSGR